MRLDVAEVLGATIAVAIITFLLNRAFRRQLDAGFSFSVSLIVATVLAVFLAAYGYGERGRPNFGKTEVYIIAAVIVFILRLLYFIWTDNQLDQPKVAQVVADDPISQAGLIPLENEPLQVSAAQSHIPLKTSPEQMLAAAKPEQPTTIAQRIGYVFWWAGAGIGGLFIVGGLFLLLSAPGMGGPETAFLAIVCGIASALTGRALRYIFSGD